MTGVAPRDDVSSRVMLRDEDCSLELKVLEIIPPDLPGAGDLRLEAKARAGDFSGRNATIWVGRPEIGAFLENLGNLVEEGTGSAQLDSMSPAELLLRIEAHGPAGRCQATGYVGRQKPCVHGWCESRVEFAVELDPAQLEATLDRLRRLLSDSEP